MAKIIPIGQPVNDSERHAIAFFRDHLPENYLALHNFEIVRDGELFEVDIAVIAPHAVYLVDVKGTRGLIDVYGSKWYPEGRQPFTSPLLKLRGHARSLKGIITASQPGRRDLEDIYVDAAILLTAPDAAIVDQGGRDLPNVTTLKKAASFFQNSSRIPVGRSKNIGAHVNMVLKAIQGVAKPRSGPVRFGNWEVLEKLGGTTAYTEYRAFNIFAGQRTTALLRAYQADPYKPADEREAQRLLISNAYRALISMPGHPNIIGVRDFFPTEGEDKYILVTEDVPGQALRIHIEKPTLALAFDQRTRIANELLTALSHLHGANVIHRNVTPSSILIGTDGRMRLTAFDYARAGTDRTRTIAQEIVDDLEVAYMAPEVHGEPSAATATSDVFSSGLVLYEVFTGEKPFANPTELFGQSGKFVIRPTEHQPDLPKGFDEWLQKLCIFEPDKRISAAQARAELEELISATKVPRPEITKEKPTPEAEPPLDQLDYSNLATNTQITPKYIVEKRLGKPGAFGVAYKVIDTLGDVSRAMKLILRDRHSTLERLKKEYRTLLRVPDHQNVVKVIDADFLPNGGPPFIVFQYIDGFDVDEMIESNLFAPEDALELARQVASGLSHLHQNGVYHCDIKPRNLLWTDRGAKIIDFNVSVLAGAGNGHGGGSRKYLPPDLDLEAIPSQADLVDRDLYALGLTFYEAITGRYPWETAVAPPGQAAPDPRELSNLSDLSPELCEVLLKAISPSRAQRFTSASEFQSALTAVPRAQRLAPVSDSSTWIVPGMSSPGPLPPNTNPYVQHLLTVYSQSKRSNAGTRGLDVVSEQTYVETALDRDLMPSVLAGEFKLVLISGNAGDGKTAFIQKLEQRAEEHGAKVDRTLPNGSRFSVGKHTFLSNYDGSQDEGDRANDDVLRDFLAPFSGEDSKPWPTKEIRIVAINEGRLVDFLETHSGEFVMLGSLVRKGLQTGVPADGVAVVNLNLRSVVADPTGLEDSILERLIRRMTHENFWEPCQGCDLRDRCYALHNARTFQDERAGPRVIERLKTLYSITHLRGRLHITLRDLRSALAFMLVGTHDCDEIHELYRSGKRDTIAQGFYFNSWMAAEANSADRLLTLLKDVDVGSGDDPRLDRSLDFVPPSEDASLFRFPRRGSYDLEVMRKLYEELPRDYSGRPTLHRAQAHQRFIEMARRRVFFERRDIGWQTMMPYKTAQRMLAVVRGEESPETLLTSLLHAINQGEGLSRPERLGGKLALEVRRVNGGTVRSYRLFPSDRFTLRLKDDATRSRFMEHMPTGLVLTYRGESGVVSELVLTLDVFEMLQRLNDGYRPSIEEEQGHYLSLSVFKNLLGSAPYQEVLLTTSGHDFYRIGRQDDGRLEMDRVQSEVA